MENAKVEDAIPTGLILDSKIVVYKLTVGADGEIKSETELSQHDNFPVELGSINSAYRLKYSTKIVEYGIEAGYTNRAVLYNGTEYIDESIVPIDKISKGSYIEKSGIANAELDATQITWTIDINKAQEALTGVTLVDALPDGLTLSGVSVKVYELNASGANWVQGNQVTTGLVHNSTEKSISIGFGDINEAYRIVFTTDVDQDVFVNDDGDFINSHDFVNTAELYHTEGGSSKKLDEDPATVTVDRSSLISKSGKEVTSYGEPLMEWTIVINKAKQKIYNAVLIDTIGDGQEIVSGSININPNIAGNSGLTVDSNMKGFTWNLGDIESTYTITYKTKITDPNLSKYSNGYKLTGNLHKGDGTGGTGSGSNPFELESDTVDAVPTVHNTYAKNAVGIDTPVTVDSIQYDGINYDAQTMSWKITVDAIKEEITSLTIIDTFLPAKSMVFLADTMRIRVGSDILVKDTNYTLTDNTVDGFTLTFIPSGTPLQRAKYEIFFKTSFDPDKVKINGGTINNTAAYKNNAHFDGSTKKIDGSTGTINTDRYATHTIKDTIFNAGKKDGTLNREAGKRSIDWKISANALGQIFTDSFVITDSISEGQSYNINSLKVYTFSVNADGSFSDGAEITSGYNIVWGAGNQFVLTFSNGISQPILVKFTTNIDGISKENYTNTAVATSGEYKKTYPKTVPYTKHNDFISKEALNAAGTKVYVDDELNWKVVLNTSLSHIDNAVFTDTISAGQVFLEGSMKQNGTGVTPTVVKNTGGSTTLTLNLGNVSDQLIITYTTVVTATAGAQISNAAQLNGTALSENNTADKTYTASQSSWGTGSGDAPRGSLEITKVDKEEEKTINNNSVEAVFELFYYINNDTNTKYIVTGTPQSTVKGVLQYANLPFRTYYLQEITAPTGYDRVEDENGEPKVFEIVIDGTVGNKDIKYSFENSKTKIDVTGTKVWVNGEYNRPNSIWLQLYKNSEAYDDPVGLTQEDVNESGEWTYVWQDLDKTNIDGIDHVYTIREVDVYGDDDFEPENYVKTEEGLTVTNTYVIPTDAAATAIKTWVGGPATKPTVWFKLFRQVIGGGLEAVPSDQADIKELKQGTESVTWEELERTDLQGREYTFFAKEVDADGEDYTPANYVKTENGLNVTNYYVSPMDASAKAVKVWENGPQERPTIWFRLFRQVGSGSAVAVPLTEAPLKELVSGITEVAWTGLTRTDGSANLYTYTVKEVDQEGNNFVPENYIKVEDGLTVTNSYTVPKTDVTGKKIWVGGPAEKPTIELQLYRDGVKFGEAVSLKNGTDSYTWTGLDQTDANGKAYKYTVDEVSVPENYKKSVSEDGLTVTNTFVDPDSEEDTGSQIPTEPGDESKPGGLPQTGEGRSTSLPGLALIVAGLALGLFSWQKRRPRKKTSGQ